jgi:hypothetical protein
MYNKDDIVPASMIATVDLFDESNFNYTATPLRDERLLELRAHQNKTYKHLKTTSIRQINRSTQRPGVVLESQGKPAH